MTKTFEEKILEILIPKPKFRQFVNQDVIDELIQLFDEIVEEIIPEKLFRKYSKDHEGELVKFFDKGWNAVIDEMRGTKKRILGF